MRGFLLRKFKPPQRRVAEQYILDRLWGFIATLDLRDFWFVLTIKFR